MKTLFISMLMLSVMLIGCGEKTDYETKAESAAKERADQNAADHERRKQ